MRPLRGLGLFVVLLGAAVWLLVCAAFALNVLAHFIRLG